MFAYGQSTANILFAVEAARRWASDGISTNAIHPGAVMETNLASNLDPDILAAAVETQDMSTRLASKAPPTSGLVAASLLSKASASGRR